MSLPSREVDGRAGANLRERAEEGGKSLAQIIAALLAVYPDGGADPSLQQLEVMMHYPRCRESPVHYVNLQRPENDPDRPPPLDRPRPPYYAGRLILACWRTLDAHALGCAVGNDGPVEHL